MNEFSTFLSGVADATVDLRGGWLPSRLSIDWLCSELRGRLACSDEYLAGYFSVIFDPSRK